ncbi:hypothetical protein M413DRAFT_440656 [Hebeloma cylindrosporum]|uniref:Uncharacterized protein n=1 Tax=Hebeloma cylindrosporum TaxID=76867 RepID=A0A0C3CSU8_HEBCY|nr:hypothetical protein M413DRAFT_440656 [Hebeloma cylindrosporum h7]
MDEPTGEGTDEPASGPLPSEPVNELANDRVDERVDENIIEPIDVDRQLGEIVGFVAEHDDLVDQPSPVPLLPPTADEDQLQSNKRKTPPFDIFLMAELEKVRNKRFVKKEGALEGSPRKRFKQEDRPAFIQGEVIDLT